MRSMDSCAEQVTFANARRSAARLPRGPSAGKSQLLSALLGSESCDGSVTFLGRHYVGTKANRAVVPQPSQANRVRAPPSAKRSSSQNLLCLTIIFQIMEEHPANWARSWAKSFDSFQNLTLREL